PRLLLRPRLLCRPGATENIAHRVIPFVAGVFDHLIIVVLLERNEEGPRLRPGLLIDDRGAVVERVLSGARELLDDLQLIAVIAGIARIAGTIGADRVFVREVRGLDDE